MHSINQSGDSGIITDPARERRRLPIANERTPKLKNIRSGDDSYATFENAAKPSLKLSANNENHHASIGRGEGNRKRASSRRHFGSVGEDFKRKECKMSSTAATDRRHSRQDRAEQLNVAPRNVENGIESGINISIINVFKHSKYKTHIYKIFNILVF